MFERRVDRRKLVAAGALALLGACTMVPKAPPPTDTGPAQPPEPTPGLPTDVARHRVALLVPMAGANSAVGQSIANAATMAILDTNAQNLRVTTYDTSAGAAEAAKRAVADGNKLILGPLLSDDIPAVAAVARPAKVPLISFSNDAGSATKDVFIMGNLPGQSVRRTVSYAAGKGVRSFAALVPRGEYGDRVSKELVSAVRAGGGAVAAMEAYDRTNTSIVSAARRLREKGGFDAVLIADGGAISARAALQIKPQAGAASPRILGTELWGGEKDVTSTPALTGAWFATVSDKNFGQFSKSYRSRFGAQPYRIATLGYDAVLLSLRVARDWKPGSDFPLRNLVDSGGFLGLDGPFRFDASGVIERALEVREVVPGNVQVVSPAPARFGG
ncbi:penicillin-binding protein activator [Novosphingobium album (ex Liu et al. 2023)]|uniref:Penicillin-binding protein activator n=1 Tax=Novosphingobium album (ex Liu et al. 2023) TaxID=3031130 RepID=A0ABT5WW12_9SPHN|nr:penicillin-binding protein activator [Novosphingobium album (ex Liu et al. 2023)]MDE8654064.1 penicillin-binding protein activator [Novosphingobium album (ex Liu et al. 2023)]